MDAKRILTTEYDQKYPVFSMVLAYVLILLTPFVSSLTAYAAFAICLYRIIRYDSKFFATDYALLIPINMLFRMPGGLTLTVFLCLIAAVVCVIREGLHANRALVILLILMNYLLLRMQTKINDFVLCFGQLFMLYALLPKQDAASAERTAKAYCGSLLTASLFALALRENAALREILGHESEAIWGSGILRFQGLLRDPNYYMTTVVVGLAALAKLKESGRIRLLSFILVGVAFVMFGILTYSKTFFLMFALLGVVFIIWQFWNKKFLLGTVLVIAVVLTAETLLFSENSPFAVVMSRFLSSEDISDLTTGRTDIYLDYLAAIVKDPIIFFFGYGIATPELERAPHNIYLQIAYHMGVVGLVLIVGFLVTMVKVLKDQMSETQEQSAISKYVVLLMMAVLYFSLQGIFDVDFYGNMFIAFLAMIISPKEES